MINTPFKDPDPALIGPPTQTTSGVVNKAPIIDNPNIKLPSQNDVDQTNYKLIDTKSLDEKFDRLGKNWLPDKFNPEDISGNDSFVDPKTGKIGSTSKLSDRVNISTDKSISVDTSAEKLASVQQGLPKPNIPKPPNTPRIKTIKIPKPSNTKGATDLLNLPKSDSR